MQTFNLVVMATEGLQQAQLHKSRELVCSSAGEIWEIWHKRNVVFLNGVQPQSRAIKLADKQAVHYSVCSGLFHMDHDALLLTQCETLRYQI